MAQDVWETNEVVVTTSGCFTTHHRLETAAGTLGEFTFPAFRMHAVFRAADGRTLLARHASLWRDRHELREGESKEWRTLPLLATARAPRFWSRAFVIQFGGREYTLKAADFWEWRWRLTDEAGMVLLEMRSRGAFRRRVYIAVYGEIDADLLAFAYYLVHTRHEERHAAAAAAGS